MLPIILEPAVTSMIDKGVIDLFLGNTFYIDLSDINNKNIKALNEAILRYNIKPQFPPVGSSLQPKIQLKPIINLLLKNQQEKINNSTLLPPIKSQKEIKIPHPPTTPRNKFKNNDIFNCVLINSLRKKWSPTVNYVQNR